MIKCQSCKHDCPFVDVGPYTCYECRMMKAWANDSKMPDNQKGSTVAAKAEVPQQSVVGRPVKVGDLVNREDGDGITLHTVVAVELTYFNCYNYSPIYITHCIRGNGKGIYWCHEDGSPIIPPPKSP